MTARHRVGIQGLTCVYRRAKIKMLAKKSLETGEDIDSIPESMRQYLAMQAMESGKGFAGSYMGRTGLLPFGGGNMLFGGDQSAQGKVCTSAMEFPSFCWRSAY